VRLLALIYFLHIALLIRDFSLWC